MSVFQACVGFVLLLLKCFPSVYRSGDSRGFGFLSLGRDEDADAAIRALDQTEWNGRIVLVEKSKTSAR